MNPTKSVEELMPNYLKNEELVYGQARPRQQTDVLRRLKPIRPKQVKTIFCIVKACHKPLMLDTRKSKLLIIFLTLAFNHKSQSINHLCARLICSRYQVP